MKNIWYIMNLALVGLGLLGGYDSQEPQRLRNTNPDAIVCGLILFKYVDGQLTPLSKPLKAKDEAEKTRLKLPERDGGKLRWAHSGRMLLVYYSDREARLIAPADFRDEVAELAVVFVLFQARVRLGIIRLQAHQFIACLLIPQARVRDLFAEVLPSIERLHTNAQESFIFRAKRRFVEKFTFHTALLQFIRSISLTKAAKSQAWRNLLQKWFFWSAVPVRNFALVFRLAL